MHNFGGAFICYSDREACLNYALHTLKPGLKEEIEAQLKLKLVGYQPYTFRARLVTSKSATPFFVAELVCSTKLAVVRHKATKDPDAGKVVNFM